LSATESCAFVGHKRFRVLGLGPQGWSAQERAPSVFRRRALEAATREGGRLEPRARALLGVALATAAAEAPVAHTQRPAHRAEALQQLEAAAAADAGDAKALYNLALVQVSRSLCGARAHALARPKP
jgi:hypothetical protein